MFDQVLGMLMQGGMSAAGERRVERAAGGGSPLLETAMQMFAGAGGSGGGGGGSGAGGLAGLARGLLGGGQGGGGLAAIAGNLLGRGPSDAAGSSDAAGGGGASGGGLGLLGGLAGAAMQHFGGGAEPGLAESPAGFAAQSGGVSDEDRAQVMIRAMLSAAKADGEIDAGEQQRIVGRLEDAGADQEARDFITAEMAKPADVDAVVAGVDSPHMAVEVYTASLFAIEVDTPAEARYMADLAAKLGLDQGLVQQLHESLGAPHQ